MKSFNKKSSVGGDALVLTVSRVLVSLMGVVTSMLLARFRTLEEYGTYSQMLMVINLFTSVFLMGLPNSINYFLAKADTKKERQTFLSVYISLSTILTIIIAVCLNLSVPLIIDYFDNPLITGFAYVFAVYPWSMLMINSLSNVCVVYGVANKLVFFNVIQSIINISVVLLAQAFSLSFGVYMVIYMATLALFGFGALLWIKKLAGKLTFKVDFSLIKQMLAFCVPMGLASVVATLNGELDKLVIGKFFTTEEYAVFANAAKTLPVTMVAESLTAVLLPCAVRFLKHGKKDETVKVWHNAINISFCFMCLIVGGLFVFAPDVMSLFYSAKYATSAGIAVFRVYTLILLFRATYWGLVLNASGKTKFILFSTIASMVMNFICNIGFYYVFGFIGPALSTFAVTFIISFVQLRFTGKILDKKIREIFPWLNMLKMLVQTAILGGCFWLVKNLLLGNFEGAVSIIISIGLGAVWALIYAAINYKFVIRNWKKLNEEKNVSEVEE